jgi:hypothetical protein
MLALLRHELHVGSSLSDQYHKRSCLALASYIGHDGDENER